MPVKDTEVTPISFSPLRRTAVIIGSGIAGLSTAVYLAKEGLHVVCLEKNSREADETSYMNGSLVCPSLTKPWTNLSNLKGCLKESMMDHSDPNKSVSILWSKTIFDKEFWKWGLHFAFNALEPNKFDKLYKCSYELAIFSKKCLDKLNSGNPGSASFNGYALGTLQLFQSTEIRDQQFEVLSKIIPNMQSLDCKQVPTIFNKILQSHLFPGGALYSSLDTSIDISILCRGLRAKAEALGVNFRMNSEFSHFETEINAYIPQDNSGETANNLVKFNVGGSDNKKTISCAVLSDNTKICGDIFIAANGNNSNMIADWAGDGWHSWPVRGFAVEIPISAQFRMAASPNKDTSYIPLQYNIVDDTRRIYIAPLPNNVMRLSGFCEFGPRLPVKYEVSETSQQHINTNNDKIDYTFAYQLIEQARRLLPPGYLSDFSELRGHADESDIKLHTCWRPQTADDLPVIGRSAEVDNLYYNSGHGHLGLTRAIGSSKLLSNMIVGKPNNIDCTPFKPSRFRYFPSIISVLQTK